MSFGSFQSSNNPTGLLTGKPNPMNDVDVPAPPEDTISCLAFNPGSMQNMTILASGSWDSKIRCWAVQANGTVTPQAEQAHQAPVLDIAFNNDGSKIFSASVDKTAKAWDLQSNQSVQIAQHDAPIKTIHYITCPSYSCVMTGSWDKTLKFWDLRSPSPMMSLPLPERCYAADVLYPLAVVTTANKHIHVYNLEKQPVFIKPMESLLKYQHRCISIFRDKKNPTQPAGFAVGSIEGRVAVMYIQPVSTKDNFTFKCHRSDAPPPNGVQDIYAVNHISFHPQLHGALATVGSDGKWAMWDKDARTRLKTSEQFDQQITASAFDATGNIFACATGYDWSKGHEYNDPNKKPHIYVRSCVEDIKSKK